MITERPDYEYGASASPRRPIAHLMMIGQTLDTGLVFPKLEETADERAPASAFPLAKIGQLNMRTLSHFDASRSLPELMTYVTDSGQGVKIVKCGTRGACVLISHSHLQSLTQQLKRLTVELDALDEDTRKGIYKAMARKD